jgi:cytoskeletal protein CcmA (bactofilin family)
MRQRILWYVAAACAVSGLAVLSVAFLAWRAGELPGLCSGVAEAQETMKFTPVPPESVESMERQRAERHAGHPSIPTPPTPGRPSEAPVAPEPPVIPEISHAGDVVRIGSDIHIEKGQEVEGDVFALRGDIRVDGHVKGNVAATGGNVHLGSTARIDGDVMCIGGQLEEEDGARVGGQRVTALRGERRDEIRQVVREKIRHEMHDVGKLGFAISWLLVSLLVAWGIAKFAPVRTGVAVANLKGEPGLSLLLGLGVVLMLVPSVVALALVSAILCITIIGIPLGIGVWVVYAGLLVVLFCWGFVVGVVPLGERLSHRLGKPEGLMLAAVYGTLLLTGLRVMAEVFHFVPLFGWFGTLLWILVFLVTIVATLMGAGALLRTKFGQGPHGRWWPLFPAHSPVSPAPQSVEPPPSAPPSPPPPAPSGEPSPAA